MAARSPYIRFRKALSRKPPRYLLITCDDQVSIVSALNRRITLTDLRQNMMLQDNIFFSFTTKEFFLFKAFSVDISFFILPVLVRNAHLQLLQSLQSLEYQDLPLFLRFLESWLMKNMNPGLSQSSMQPRKPI